MLSYRNAQTLLMAMQKLPCILPKIVVKQHFVLDGSWYEKHY